MTQTKSDDVWLGTGEAGARLGVTAKTARRIIIENGVYHRIPNVQLRVRESDLASFMAQREAEQAETLRRAEELRAARRRLVEQRLEDKRVALERAAELAVERAAEREVAARERAAERAAERNRKAEELAAGRKARHRAANK